MKRRLLSIKRGGGFDFTSDLMGYWKLATNSLDSSGRGHNGTDINMTYAGGYAQFGSGYIQVADSDDFSFTDGLGNDLSFCFLFSFIWNDRNGLQWFINKRQSDLEYQIASDGTNINLSLFSPNTSNRLFYSIPVSSLNSSGLNTLLITYNGSKNVSGINAYVNGYNSVGSGVLQGVYSGMTNGNSPLVMGSYAANYFKGIGKEWAIWKGRTMTPEEITEIDRRVKAGEPLI